MSEKAAPEINVRFVYNFCNDLGAMRRFYTELLGLDEAAYSEEHRYLCYQSEGFQFMFFRPDAEVPLRDGWADQPAYAGGTTFDTSWSIEIPEEEFAATGWGQKLSYSRAVTPHLPGQVVEAGLSLGAE